MTNAVISLLKSEKRPLIMGIVNVTPDSFSDGGYFYDAAAAIAHGQQLIIEGADILDIGGESTRPDAEPVAPDEEMKRILPVITGLKNSNVPISIDTRHSETMVAATKTGACMINDVMALRNDGCLEIAAQSGVPVCLMHMQGDPKTMQKSPEYNEIVDDIQSFFDERISACLKSGIKEHNIIIDPGIGFGKTLEHNLTILKNISRFKEMGFPVLIGLSRKSFIGHIFAQSGAQERLGGSLAGAIFAAVQGADILRVHDVMQTRQALSVWNALSA